MFAVIDLLGFRTGDRNVGAGFRQAELGIPQLEVLINILDKHQQALAFEVHIVGHRLISDFVGNTHARRRAFIRCIARPIRSPSSGACEKDMTSPTQVANGHTERQPVEFRRKQASACKLDGLDLRDRMPG